MWILPLSIFHLDKLFFKTFLLVYHFQILEIHHRLYLFQRLQKVELVKNDFHKVQIVTHYCYWTLFYSKWKYILSWLISVNMNSSITKGLRTLYWLLSILGGVNQHFTQEPSNPSYFINGSDANLVWDYADPQNDIQSIIYSVLVNGKLVEMLVNDSLGVQEHYNILPSYKGRVKIERRATLVIKNINPRDNTEFQCELRGGLSSLKSTVQLIVAGTYYRHNH